MNKEVFEYYELGDGEVTITSEKGDFDFIARYYSKGGTLLDKMKYNGYSVEEVKVLFLESLQSQRMVGMQLLE